MVNKHQFQMLAKAFRAGKISLSDFTEQAYNPPAEEKNSNAASVDEASQNAKPDESSKS
jgi:hypothetical protein